MFSSVSYIVNGKRLTEAFDCVRTAREYSEIISYYDYEDVQFIANDPDADPANNPYKKVSPT